MSSAAPAVVPQSVPTTIRAFCKTPLSVFERLLDMANYTQLRCVCLVAVETIGFYSAGQSGRIWAEISMDDWKAATSIRENETIYAALSALVDDYKLLRSRTNLRGRTEYALREEFIQEVQGKKIRGRCPDCKTVGEFSTEYIPVIHTALRRLGACVSPATFKVVMLIIRYTMKHNRERGLYLEPYELKISDFETFTGLERREITNGLSEAKKLGLVDRRTQGIRTWYWVIPENFAQLEKRGPRLVTQPERGAKHPAKPKSNETAEKPTKPQETHAIESGYCSGVRCFHCGHFVEPEPVEETAIPESSQNRPSRAGPGRETGKKKSKLTEFLDRFEAKYAAN